VRGAIETSAIETRNDIEIRKQKPETRRGPHDMKASGRFAASFWFLVSDFWFTPWFTSLGGRP
jgi:hypothetical protein